ncbi:hypothetical protein M569_02777 [Genlisea aurea]|uniref:Pyroglutamyl-peptidase I n=1 Tax=Genlisea aurea TaxID=192259 RepID=S8CYA6_9LAMI|nr:hypothetical protein M569_02777 [Genlisea aurea]
MGSEENETVKINVTGLKKFHGVEENPAETIVNNLRDYADHRVLPDNVKLGICKLLETAGDGAISELYKLLEAGINGEDNVNVEKVVWLHIGVSSGLLKFTLQRQAVNEATFCCCPDELKWQRQTSCAIEAILELLKMKGFDAVISNDAGRYVCNFVYYHSLMFAERKGPGTEGLDRIEEKKIEGMETATTKKVNGISRLAIDIGGSLIKVVYLSGDGHNVSSSADERLNHDSSLHDIFPGGGLDFLTFETSKINEFIEFLSSVLLQRGARRDEAEWSEKLVVKATGGGAFKFASLFMEKLGITLDKVDEMDSLVAGANLVLKAWDREAFTYMDGRKEYVEIDEKDLYPYLLVNIGSGVSMIKVDSGDKFERVSGTSIGGGTLLGLGRLLTKCKSFDELLELSVEGNNRAVDMLVGDIYGGMDYAKIGLTSTAIASSFGKAVSERKELEDYRGEDVARSLLRMISNNIAQVQIAYLNALHHSMKRILFGGFFIRGHEYTMDTISVGVHYWSKGEAKAMFLRHEGFLGALGAFLAYDLR